MTRFLRASLTAAMAISSIVVPTTVVTTGAAASAPAAPSWYRETVYYSTEYGPGTSPFPGPGPTPGGSTTRTIVGWDRYYCDGSVRSYGMQTGDYEDFYFQECD